MFSPGWPGTGYVDQAGLKLRKGYLIPECWGWSMSLGPAFVIYLFIHLLIYFGGRVALCSSDCPGTCSADQTGLGL